MAFQTYSRDLRFILFEQLDLGRLFSTPRYSEVTQDLAEMIVNEADKFAVNVLAPINKEGDKVGAKHTGTGVTVPDSFKAAWAKQGEAGWLGLTGNPEFGGQGLPFSLKLAVDDLFFSANTSFALTGSLCMAATGVIDEFGADWMKKAFLERIFTGVWTATMCLTEPGAGSTLGHIKTTATPIDGQPGKVKVNGSKIFITMGEHDMTENIIHLVLAKLPDAPAGTRGISMIVVPKYKLDENGDKTDQLNDVACTRIEEKMGIHASATCQLSFGENDDCEGYLLGKEHMGMMYMFRMMNEERIVVGMQGTSLASSGYLYSLAYAKERAQGPSMEQRKDRNAPNVPIIQHPDVRRMLLHQKSVVEGTRALLLQAAYFTDLANSLEDEKERAYYQGFVELLTPICKSFCTDRGFESCVTGIQVLGGYGFTSEYDAEQYARDAKIGAIYEGTNFIQAQDFVGRKIPMAGRGIFNAYMEVIDKELTEIAGNPRLAPYVAQLKETKKVFEQCVATLFDKGDDALWDVMANALRFVDMMGEVVCSYLLLKQANLADTKLQEAFKNAGASDEAAQRKLIESDDHLTYYDGKISSARFFVTQILPQVYAQAKTVDLMDDVTKDVIFA